VVHGGNYCDDFINFLQNLVQEGIIADLVAFTAVISLYCTTFSLGFKVKTSFTMLGFLHDPTTFPALRVTFINSGGVLTTATLPKPSMTGKAERIVGVDTTWNRTNNIQARRHTSMLRRGLTRLRNIRALPHEYQVTIDAVLGSITRYGAIVTGTSVKMLFRWNKMLQVALTTNAIRAAETVSPKFAYAGSPGFNITPSLTRYLAQGARALITTAANTRTSNGRLWHQEIVPLVNGATHSGSPVARADNTLAGFGLFLRDADVMLLSRTLGNAASHTDYASLKATTKSD
jgi:hypothetical protein